MASQGKGAKAKGSGFERKVAKMLTEWWQTGNLEGEFYKTPASGGLRWEKRPDTIGDICTPEGFTQTIECKCREDWEYSQFIEKGKLGKDNLYAWLKQACDEAERANKLPWLILKKNYHKPLLICAYVDKPSNFYASSMEYTYTFFPQARKNWNKISVIDLNHFLEMMQPDMFIERN